MTVVLKAVTGTMRTAAKIERTRICLLERGGFSDGGLKGTGLYYGIEF